MIAGPDGVGADSRQRQTPRASRGASIRWAILATLMVPAAASAQSVDTVVAGHRGECTTAGVEGLSEQLVRAHLCMFPGTVTTFTPYPGITLTSSRVHPLSAVETRDALHRAADAGPLQVNSAFRTLVEQFSSTTRAAAASRRARARATTSRGSRSISRTTPPRSRG